MPLGEIDRGEMKAEIFLAAERYAEWRERLVKSGKVLAAIVFCGRDIS